MEEVISGYGRGVIMLRDEDMLPAVEEFIASLEEQVESNPEALKRTPRTPSEIRAIRQKNLKRVADYFAENAASDDLFFLENVLERWDVYTNSYSDKDRPVSPIMAAFQYETDERWLVPVSYGSSEHVNSLTRIIEQKNWLSDLLKWIADTDPKSLSPCLIASKAAGMQEAWDKARAAA